MTEKQFIQELEQALSRLPEDERKDILNDIREYFADGREDGKSENEIAASLGSPRKIASELVETYPFKSDNTKTEATSKVLKITDDNFTKVEIDVQHGALFLSPSDSNETIIELCGATEKLELTADVINDTLTIKLKNKGHWLFFFNFNMKAVNLNVFIPKKLYQSISMKSDNGRIQAEKMISKRIQANTDNGRICLTELATSTLEAETDNGRIELTRVQSDQLKTKTDNGRILMSHVEADTIHAESDNGRIEMSQVDGELVATTDNGRITLDTETIDRNIDFKTDNGSIEINSTCRPTNASILAKTGLGRIDIYGERNSRTDFGAQQYTIRLKSGNGRITVR